MKRNLLPAIYGVVAFLSLSSHASALPMLSVDTDLSLAGIQSSRTVLNGTSFVIGIFISGVTDDANDPDDGVNGFELDLDFNSSVLTATSVADGGFLLPAVFEIENDIAAPDVNFAEVTLGFPPAAFGSGLLATIGFDAIAVGSSSLDLNDVILSAPFGTQLGIERIDNGVINVVQTASLPSSLALLVAGLVTGAWSRRRQSSRA